MIVRRGTEEDLCFKATSVLVKPPQCLYPGECRTPGQCGACEMFDTSEMRGFFMDRKTEGAV